MADFAVGQSRMLYGATMQSERPAHRMSEQWHPLGPVGVITASQLSGGGLGLNAFLAAIAGDPVIWKPLAESAAVRHCSAAGSATRSWSSRGTLAFFVVHRRSAVAGPETIVRDPRLPLISFTGSVPVGRRGRAGRPALWALRHLELSGNNAVIVDDSADMDLAVRAIVFGAVGTRSAVHDDPAGARS